MKETVQEILLVYCSAATSPYESADIVDLPKGARKYNDKNKITGMLLYSDGSFFQVLEGEAETLHNLYAKIERDNRHTKIIKLIEEPIQKRTFSNWSMGYAEATRADLSSILGLNDFFVRGSSFEDLEPGRARVLLDAFRKGKWRMRLAS